MDLLFNPVFEPIILGSTLIILLLLQQWRANSLRLKQFITLSLAICCIVFVTRFFQLIQIQQYYHTHDLYHYMIGGKYFNYLGYEGLYASTAQALVEQGVVVDDLNIRDLHDKNNTKNLHWREDAQKIKNMMSPSLWTEFKNDIWFFSEKFKHYPQNWQTIFSDHGFNPAPFWILQAMPILHAQPLANLWTWSIFIDYGLLILTGFVLLLLTKDWHVRWAMLAIYWFVLTYYPSVGTQAFLYTTGSLLRYTWLFYLTLGMVLLTKQHYYAAGLILTLAGLERIFPFAFVGAVILWLGWQVYSTRTFTWQQLKKSALIQFSSGVVISALGVTLLCSIILPSNTFGLFVQNIQSHQALFSSNYVGYKKIAIDTAKNTGRQFWFLDKHDETEITNDLGAGARGQAFYQIIIKRYQKNYVAIVLQVMVLILLIIVALRYMPLIEATWILGIGLIFYLTLISYYYQLFLAPYAAMLWYLGTIRRKTIIHMIYVMLFFITLNGTALFFSNPSEISLAISIGLWLLLPLATSSYLLRLRQHFIVMSIFLLGWGLIVSQNWYFTPPELSPYDKYHPIFQVSGHELHPLIPAMQIIERTYLDENADFIKEDGVILRENGEVSFKLMFDKLLTEPLQLLIRSDFNYPVTLTLSVNQHDVEVRHIARLGSLWGYETFPIPTSVLQQGSNTFKIQLTEGKAFALFHVWGGYFSK